MRSVALLLGTVGLLLVAFGVYWVMQPSGDGLPALPRAATQTPPTAPAPPPPSVVEGAITGPGEDVWVRSYDDRTGRLASQFRAARYDPDAAGTRVVRPQARFFLSNGQVLSIDAQRGRVVTGSQAAAGAGQISGMTQTPSRGELNDVEITLYQSESATEPLLTCRVNNIVFDNDTFRIATDSYTDEAGRTVPAEQVEVVVTGRDFDFEGRGLTIRWNERDQRLELLEIAHGKSMTIKNPAAFGGPHTRAQAPYPLALASAGRGGAGLAADSREPRRPLVVYQATFEQAVRISQDNRPLAQADLLRAEFAPDAEDDSAPPTTSQAGRAEQRRARPAEPESPILVEWTGRLRIIPLDETAFAQRSDAKPSFELIGQRNPVAIVMDGAQMSAASVMYRAQDQRLLVRGSEQWPTVQFVDAGGVAVQTGGIDYSRARQTASLTGPSRARLPAGRGPQATPVEAMWEEMCVLGFAADPGGRLRIESADLSGKVRLAHPHLRLAAHRVELSLADAVPEQPVDEKPARSIALRRLTASRDVLCELHDDTSVVQRLEAQKLIVHAEPLADGSIRPTSIEAEGKVRASDDQQELMAGRMVAVLEPVGQGDSAPRMALAELSASDDVRVKGRNGAHVWGDQLRISGARQQRIELVGRPTAGLSDGRSELTGSIIRIDSQAGRAHVTGAGKLVSAVGTAGPEASPPFTVAWVNELSVDGPGNWVEINGDVSVTSVDPDRTVSTARARRLTMTLGDAPTSATQPQLGAVDVLAGKVIEQIVLHEDAELRSVLVDAQEQPLRRAHLFAPRIRYELATHRLSVADPGRMLFEDRRPADPTRTAARDFRGAVAFAWQDSLVYNQSTGKAAMQGEVVVVYEPTTGDGEAFRLDADDMIAEMQPRGGSDQALPLPVLSPAAGEARLRRVRATGNVLFSSTGIRFEAAEIEYEPASNIVAARGTPRHPVSVLDATGLSTGSFAELHFNTQTEKIRLRNLQATMR